MYVDARFVDPRGQLMNTNRINYNTYEGRNERPNKKKDKYRIVSSTLTYVVLLYFMMNFPINNVVMCGILHVAIVDCLPLPLPAIKKTINSKVEISQN